MLGNAVWEEEVNRLKGVLVEKEREVAHARGQVELERSRANRAKGDAIEEVRERVKRQYDVWRKEAVEGWEGEVKKQLGRVKDAEARCGEMESVLTQRDARLRSAESEVTSLMDQAAAAAEHTHAHRRQISNLTTTVNSLTEQVRTLEAAGSTSKSSERRCAAEVALLRRQLAQKEETIVQLEGKLATVAPRRS